MTTATAEELWDTGVVRIRNRVCPNVGHQKPLTDKEQTKISNVEAAEIQCDNPDHDHQVHEKLILRECPTCFVAWGVDSDGDLWCALPCTNGHVVTLCVTRQKFLNNSEQEGTVLSSPGIAMMQLLSQKLLMHDIEDRVKRESEEIDGATQ